MALKKKKKKKHWFSFSDAGSHKYPSLNSSAFYVSLTTTHLTNLEQVQKKLQEI